jgi:hypothetical protein
MEAGLSMTVVAEIASGFALAMTERVRFLEVKLTIRIGLA